MTSRHRLIIAVVAIAACGCELRDRTITPPESTYSRTRAPVIVNGASEMADVARVNPEFFKAEGLKPLLGRFFIVDEYQAGGSAVAVVSHAYWTDRFKAVPATIGTQILVDGKKTVIVGVAPPSLQPAQPASVWIPTTGPM